MPFWQRGPRRRLAMGLATVLGLAPRGFFIPYRHAGSVQASAYPELEPAFKAAWPEFAQLLAAIESEASLILAAQGPAPRPRLDQAWFPCLDAAAAFALVRLTRPARIVEIGSGHSTRWLAAALAGGAHAPAITCIDPAPRASLAGLPVEWRRQLLQAVGATPFQTLAAGDILFIDSSHVCMPGSDVDLLIGRILPTLAPGVLVHVHDIFLPDPYPSEWAWRGYNEQTPIAALLQGGRYRLRFASHYTATRQPAALAQALAQLPAPAGPHASSLWLEKTA